MFVVRNSPFTRAHRIVPFFTVCMQLVHVIDKDTASSDKQYLLSKLKFRSAPLVHITPEFKQFAKKYHLKSATIELVSIFPDFPEFLYVHTTLSVCLVCLFVCDSMVCLWLCALA
jgi:hypothetical protein